ncbi:divalent metal binding domain protein [Pantoea phage Phynn]|nr:divalent metal binding domain protein [Pantoea phage Phynn]
MTITTLEFKNAVSKPTPTNHVFVCDVSYSMAYELPKIRKHLKANIASLVKQDDTISIVYFSHRGQFGSVFTGEKVSNLSDLSNLNKAIDRYLAPIGATGFVEPLGYAAEIAEDLQMQNGNLNSMIFLTDGYDNSWSTAEILKACTALPLTFNSITFLEYGYYVNRPLLEKMSEATNALHTFVENFDAFEPAFDSILATQNSPRVEVNTGNATHALYIDEGRVYVLNAANGVVLVPEHIKNVTTIGDNAINEIDSIADETTLYLVLYYAVHSMNPDLAWKVLKALGDIRLIKAYDNCFTKQDYSNAKDLIEEAVTNKEARFTDGIDHNMVPDENAFTLVDALEVISKSDAVIDLTSPHWEYNRTGRQTVQKDDDTLDTLSAQIAAATTAEERKELAAKLVEYQEWKPEFTATTRQIEVKHIVGNSSRPNISINTDMQGFVTVPESLQDKYSLPDTIPTKQVRNYTIVKDGIINMKVLPLETDIETLKNLRASGLSIKPLAKVGEDRMSVLVHLTSLPLVNRSMTKGISGKKFLEDSVMLELSKARQKVMKFFRDEAIGKRNAEGLKEAYGEEAANFLSEKGIRDYGFSPKVERTESTDVYMSKELNVKIAGMSSLPAVKATLTKRGSGKKLNNGDLAILWAHDAIIKEMEAMDKDDIIGYLDSETKNAINYTRELNRRLSRTMYGIVVGKGWFSDIDFENPVGVVDSKELGIQGLNTTFNLKIELEEKEIKI